MKAQALTIHWHSDNQPIYSVHFQPGAHGGGRFATAGGDNNVRLWSLRRGPDRPEISYLATLAKHTQSVNVVRFDPKGEMLASGGDDGNVIVWAPSETQSREFGAEWDDRESWKTKLLCRMSVSEVYDIAWSPDSLYFVAGSMDNVSRIYSAVTGMCVRQIAEHNHYVQGVAWDPFNEYIATQSADRSVHIYTLKSKDGQFTFSPYHKITKADLPFRKIAATSPAPTAATMASPQHPTTAVSSPSSVPMKSVPSQLTAPSTPNSTMNPPTHRTSHSRHSSFGSASSVKRSPSQSPTMASLPLPAVRPLEVNKQRNSFLYHSETMTSFFRRLTFTVDGSLLLTPAGQFRYHSASDKDSEDIVTNTVYIYTRSGLNRPPVAHLPGFKEPAVAVKCNPILYKLRESEILPTEKASINTNQRHSTADSPKEKDASTADHNSEFKSTAPPAFALPYRLIFAVATQDSVLVYDTQQTTPLCYISNLHYAAFTDLSWSPDGNTLLISSNDGFCSAVSFEPGEIGERYSEDTVTIPPPPAMSTQHLSKPVGTQSSPIPSLATPVVAQNSTPLTLQDSDSVGSLTPTITSVPSPVISSASMYSREASQGLSPPGTPHFGLPMSVMANGPYSQVPLFPPSPRALHAAPAKRSAEEQDVERKKKRIVPTLVGPAPAAITADASEPPSSSKPSDENAPES
ncbi:hypothetical protein CANCADRAFT_26767 [Tortispora caseinolytica NRRL Y-17796]|uniref:CAF1B/HIR1 beta-propeller domain-containing protein n=1 Tax=Tortispora caseinolytica NRRL Y-17796 TaxID=767744 RepID=A0A1E4TDR8_9ASCO|nr:hypothetical protein CANCADRAFT_26767 [Tortispora caseinolytica NRRL Y-17796]